MPSKGQRVNAVNQTVIADFPQPKRPILNVVDDAISCIDVAFPQSFCGVKAVSLQRVVERVGRQELDLIPSLFSFFCWERIEGGDKFVADEDREWIMLRLRHDSCFPRNVLLIMLLSPHKAPLYRVTGCISRAPCALLLIVAILIFCTQSRSSTACATKSGSKENRQRQ